RPHCRRLRSWRSASSLSVARISIARSQRSRTGVHRRSALALLASAAERRAGRTSDGVRNDRTSAALRIAHRGRIAMRLTGTRLVAMAFLLLAAPLALEAQQGMRRVAVVLGYAQDDREGQIRLAAFVETLAQLGWSDGRNVRLGGHFGRDRLVAC